MSDLVSKKNIERLHENSKRLQAKNEKLEKELDLLSKTVSMMRQEMDALKAAVIMANVHGRGTGATQS